MRVIEPESRDRVRWLAMTSWEGFRLRRYGIGVVVAGMLFLVGPCSAVTITGSGQTAVTLPPGAENASELSGISWLFGAHWAVVSDDVSSGAQSFTLEVVLDPVTGTVVGMPVVVGVVGLETGNDPEGVAVLEGGQSLMVADEVGPAIREFDAATGDEVESLDVPTVFVTGLRSNLGLESLGLGPDGSLWTANEEALSSDGPVSSFAVGTIVRIQRFDSDRQPSGQWGYITDEISGDIFGTAAGRDIERNGVVDLAVLPDGELLAMERMLGGDGLGAPIFRIRIYELDLTAADDTTLEANLVLGSFVPVSKTLRWEGVFPALAAQRNFEGLAVGPTLDGGQRALLLVADDAGNGGANQAILALRAMIGLEIFTDGFEDGSVGEWTTTVGSVIP